MKINWKHLATTPGYRSLKAAYIRDVQKATRSARPMRDKTEFLKKFIWVIGRAKHYAQHFEVPIAIILNEWESKRNYWWLNYYQECNQPKFHTHNRYTRKPRGKPQSQKDPRRWSTLEKKYHHIRRKYLQQESVS
jgi:hypothetical protein